MLNNNNFYGHKHNNNKLNSHSHSTHLFIMRKLAGRATIALALLESTAHPTSLTLLPLRLFVLFFLLLVVTTMINPYNSPQNLSPIQVIYNRKYS